MSSHWSSSIKEKIRKPFPFREIAVIGIRSKVVTSSFVSELFRNEKTIVAKISF